MRHPHRSALALTAALVAAAPPATAAAQRPDHPYVGQTLSTNPLALPVGFASGEYERAVGRRGFAVGVTAGVAHAHTFAGSSTVITVTDYGQTVVSSVFYATSTAPTLGATLDYNFLIGRERRFLIGIGVGAKSAVGGRGTRAYPLSDVIADPRLQIGFGF